jgi:hypothetical protein
MQLVAGRMPLLKAAVEEDPVQWRRFTGVANLRLR